MTSRSIRLSALVALLIGACGEDADLTDDAGPPDASSPDAFVMPDEPDAAPDADLPDAAPDAAPDAMPLGPETCDNGMDDNGDMLADCADPKCGGEFLCQAPACPAGQTRMFVHATDLPKLFQGNTTTLSTIQVPATVGKVTDAAVRVTIGHNYITDIVIKLISPAGTTLDISSNNGSNGQNYYHSAFSDHAMTAVTAGTAPFTGVYRPEDRLSKLDGEAVTGAWKLQVRESFDDDPGETLDTGGFASFDLALCVCDGCEVGTLCTDHNDNDADGMKDCEDPDCEGHVTCIPETACADGLDNDQDMKIDCKDDQCNGRNHCEFATEVSCSDNFDNDADGTKDCADTNCQTTALCMAETNCTNGVDDDQDGKTDCADPGCMASSSMCQATETSCSDGFDNDGDDKVDCDDPNCAPLLICQVPPCPSGSTELRLMATDLPVTVPDNNPAGGTSTINITQTGTVQRVIVIFSATHSFNADMLVNLIAPNASSPGLNLATHRPGANFANTVFSDNAVTSITMGTAPYTGAFKPQTPLSMLVGTPLQGAWKLFAVDDVAIGAGTVTRYELSICYTP